MRSDRSLAAALLAAALLAAAGPASAEPVVLGDFSAGGLGEWDVRGFEGETRYRMAEVDGRRVVEALAEAGASSLYLEREIDLAATPVIEWSWRIDGVLDVPDERAKEGDDFAARLYVVAPGEGVFGRPIAICYVWSNRAAPGEDWPNPFTGQVRMLALDSGAEGAGEWRTHRRDVAEDFRRLFGREVRELEGVAVMTDSDNSGQAARGWYGDVRALPPGG